jgi:hypothetical protein
VTRRLIPWYTASFHPGGAGTGCVNKEGDAVHGKDQTHLHPVQLRVVVGLGEAGKHKIVRVLEERPSAESGRREHGRVQRPGRLMGVRRRLLLRLVMLRRRGRRRRRWQIFAGLVNDAQLHDGWRVDWATIGWGCGGQRRAHQSDTPRPQRMAFQRTHAKKKEKENTQQTYKIKGRTNRRKNNIPPTPHILACLGCCLTKRSYSRSPSIVV